MNLPRIFANAIARRVAFVVVGALCAVVASCLGMGEARAQTGDTIQQAYAKCLARRAQVLGWAPNYLILDCVHYPDAKQFWLQWASPGTNAITATYPYVTACVDGVWNPETGTCEGCGDRSPLGAGAWTGVNSDMQMCQDGCTFEGGIGGGVGVCLPVVIDGTTYQHCTSWGPTGAQCSAGVGNGSLAPPDSDGDGTSDGNDPSPNNPGSGGGGGEDGEGQGEDGSSSCGGPGQPVCEEDGSNSGSGKGNTSGGGGDCTSPPSSTGDAILAQIAFQTWATRCAIAGNANGGGGGSGSGDGDGDQPGWTEGNGPANPEDTSAEDIANASDWGIGISADLLDTENIFGNASCPALPAFSIMGYEIDTSAFTWWCTLISIMRAAIIIMGAFTAIQILLGRF